MNHPPLDKRRIASNFSGAVARYETVAKAQAHMARALARLLPPTPPPGPMVDLGCGTGLLSAQLLERYPRASLTGIDIAPGMIASCRRRWGKLDRAQFITGDAEDPRMLIARTGLVACGCTAQWFADLEGSLGQWARTLTPGGRLACAFVLQGSFHELTDAFRDVCGEEYQRIRLLHPSEGQRIATMAGLKITQCAEETIAIRYPSARAALRSFHQIGADFRGQPGYIPLNAAQTRRLLARYASYAGPDGLVPVTHCVQYLIAEKS